MSRSVSQVYFLGPDLDRQAQKKENEGLAIQGPVETKEMYRQQVTSFFFTMPSFPSPGHRGSGHLTLKKAPGHPRPRSFLLFLKAAGH